jgi:[citrate (pro-3S)-lyase] ligase
MFTIKEVLIEEDSKRLISFLKQYGLDYEFDITYSILVYEGDTLVATGSLAGNIMKCFLVIPSYQQQNITNIMFHHMVHILQEQGIDHYFVFTLPKNETIFTSLHMTTIVKTMNAVLLEGGQHIKDVLTALKRKYHISDNKKAAVIINANPMTKGHLYLIEKAASENKEVLVFVVSEDQSSFPFKDRFSIIQQATAHLDNVTVLPTLSYLVSHITFPKYFLKEDQLIKDEQTLIDVLVYKQYYTKIFHINKRYVGEEPFSFTTAKYNKVLHDHLNSHLIIIPRKTEQNQIISASMVRKLIKAGKLEKVQQYVPDATYRYLQSDAAKPIIELIQSTTLRRH